MKGNLYLIPTTLGDSKIATVIPQMVIEIINEIDYYIVENVRTARRYLRKCRIKKAIDDLTFYTLNKHTSPNDLSGFLSPISEGKNIGILSEAGCPSVADPGADIVKLAHQKKIRIVPLVGPSSILLSLMASGLNGQNFAFIGYLPVKKNDKINKIKSIEGFSRQSGQTQIFIETPYRNTHLIEDIVKNCNPATQLCIATDITLESEFIITKTINEWKKKLPDIHKRPTIFLLQGH